MEIMLEIYLAFGYCHRVLFSLTITHRKLFCSRTDFIWHKFVVQVRLSFLPIQKVSVPYVWCLDS
jgi:hypothetical protein